MYKLLIESLCSLRSSNLYKLLKVSKYQKMTSPGLNRFDKVLSQVKRIPPQRGYEIKPNGELYASRLCKMALFTIFKRVLEKRRLGGESTEAIYHKAKKLARDYRKCKRWIYNRFGYSDEGQWIQHPNREQIENIFINLTPVPR